jgi:hypothetical protein
MIITGKTEQERELLNELGINAKPMPLTDYEIGEKEQKAITCIYNRCAYDKKQKKNIFVNKLIFWGSELMMLGLSGEEFRVVDYKKTWELPKNE